MNRRFLTLAAALMLMTGCSKDLHPPQIGVNIAADETVAGDFVTPGQVKSVLQKMFPQTKVSEETGFEVEAVTGAAGDTLMYIVNISGGGWKVLSADARTPAVLAEGDEGSFSIEEACDGLKAWMDCVASDMEAVRSAATEELNFTSEEISANRTFWGADAQPAAQSPTPLPNPGGRWSVTTTSVVHVADSVEHMTPLWSQNDAYSAYCPLKSNSSEDRAPAGCVAVAGAEVMYYLHSAFGVPTTMVSDGFCNGNINNYSRSFYAYSSEIWSQMRTDYSIEEGTADAEALMIGHIGDMVEMHYHNNYSWALPEKLAEQMFAYHGISADYGSYDEEVVKSNLEAGLPIIVTASEWAVPANFNIHCFVIDGYKRTFTENIQYHHWIPDDFDDPNAMLYEPYVTRTYTDPEITAVNINWGWGPGGETAGWYTLTGDWKAFDNTNYKYNRSMVYDITLQH